ncbi:hypothetical protein ANO11243_080930 [Dothideomycetidae sp. 11243]|nr:hypothetical protein ANO11243_080930 [fungal sp. No.11243]
MPATGLPRLLTITSSVWVAFAHSVSHFHRFQWTAASQTTSTETSTTPSFHNAIKAATAAQTTLTNGVLRFTRTRVGASPDLLWLVLTYDNGSWGQLADNKGPRDINHLHNLVSSQYDVSKISLGLLTSSMDEYELYKQSVRTLDYGRVDIFFHPGFHEGPVVDREHRHDDKYQKDRRAEMAKLRNYLMLKTLREEQHILWSDADVWHFDDGVVRRMIQHTEEHPDFGVLTTRCAIGNVEDYDLNAWKGTRQGPRGWDLTDEEIKKGELEQQGQYHAGDLLKGSHDDDLIPLDTVGATILYMRASLVMRGLNFPHQYTVGTRWGKDGWDGIESEGICYRARGLQGGRCGLLGGRWHVEHTSR